MFSPTLCSALVSSLDFAKYVYCKGSCCAVLPILHHQETLSPNSIVHWLPSVMHISVTPEFLSVRANWHSECHRKLTFISVTETYVRRHILRIDPSFRASCWCARQRAGCVKVVLYGHKCWHGKFTQKEKIIITKLDYLQNNVLSTYLNTSRPKLQYFCLCFHSHLKSFAQFVTSILYMNLTLQ